MEGGISTSADGELALSSVATTLGEKKFTKSEYRYVVSKKQRMTLTCEWSNCTDVFEAMDEFLNHITSHLRTIVPTAVEEITQESHVCKWRNCNHEIHGGFLELMRHVYFHGFHIKLKSVGMSVTLGKNLKSCMMNSDSRNMIPDLPERFHCGWKHCEAVSDNPYYFYDHVRGHAEEYPSGKKHNHNCRCWWEGCEYVFAQRYKLMDHLRSHTQEKIVACPTCGSLFSSTTKYVDHLKRQDDLDVQSYQCSHCSKRFSSERLLRDHMRKHVNNYKCPFCEMTTPSPSSLRQHIKYRHSDERDYLCDHCGSSFKSARDRQRHIDTRHGEDAVFTCTHTGCKFKTKHEFEINQHLRNKHGGEKVCMYMCDICKSKYTRGRTLTIHLMKTHNLRWPPGHKKFRYKLGSDGNFHLQTVRYESYELSQQLQSERQRKALAGLNADVAKITKKKMPNDGGASALVKLVSTRQAIVSALGPMENTNENTAIPEVEGVLDLSKKSTRNNKKSENASKDEYSYNLNMLGEVALSEQTKEKRKSGDHNGKSPIGKSGKGKNKGKGKKSKSLKVKSGKSSEINAEVQNGTTDNQQQEQLPKTPTKTRKRKRKDDSPTKLLIKMRKGATTSEDDDNENGNGNNDEDAMPQTLQFVTEDGQVIVVDTDMPNSYNENEKNESSSSLKNNNNDVTEVDVIDYTPPEGVVLNIQLDGSEANDENQILNMDIDCSYYTVVAGDSENIIGVVNSQTGVYTPIPEGYILNVQNNESSPAIGQYTIGAVTPEIYGVGSGETTSVKHNTNEGDVASASKNNDNQGEFSDMNGEETTVQHEDDQNGNGVNDICDRDNNGGSQSQSDEYESVEVGVATIINGDEKS